MPKNTAVCCIFVRAQIELNHSVFQSHNLTFNCELPCGYMHCSNIKAFSYMCKVEIVSPLPIKQSKCDSRRKTFEQPGTGKFLLNYLKVFYGRKCPPFLLELLRLLYLSNCTWNKLIRINIYEWMQYAYGKSYLNTLSSLLRQQAHLTIQERFFFPSNTIQIHKVEIIFEQR